MTPIQYLVRITLLALLCGAVSGCSYLFGNDGLFPSKADDYKNSPELPVMKVPQGKDAGRMQEAFPIPNIEEDVVLAGEFEVPRPTPLVAGAGEDFVRIQRLAEDSWVLVEEAPGQLWPQVRSFLSAAGIQIVRVDARSGILESGWLQLEGKPMASRFRYRIERGVQRGTSELHVLQMNQAGDINSWPDSSDDLEQESEMLQSLAQYIANSTDSAPVSMIADQAISATGRITLQETTEGKTYISLGLSSERAWASLARALERSHFEITDRDRSAGLYFVTFRGPNADEEGGWFDWFGDGDDDNPLIGSNFKVEMTEKADDVVNITLDPVGEIPDYEKRQEQALLSAIKGNIN